MLDTLDARLAQTRDGKLGHLEFLQVPPPWPGDYGALASNNTAPSRTSISLSARNCPRRCCATCPRCAGWRPASR
jgi:hypothetical protein